jgi:hypothetical protein
VREADHSVPSSTQVDAYTCNPPPQTGRFSGKVLDPYSKFAQFESTSDHLLS